MFLNNGEQQKSYVELECQNVKPTRWRNEPCLNAWELMGDFNYFAGKVGMNNFASIYTNTYQELALEFIASFHDTVGETKRENSDMIEFSLKGETRNLTLKQFATFFSSQIRKKNSPP